MPRDPIPRFLTADEREQNQRALASIRAFRSEYTAEESVRDGEREREEVLRAQAHALAEALARLPGDEDATLP